METINKDYTRKQAALMLGVHQDTILYWEENNLISPPRRNPKNNYRIYNIDDVMEIAKKRGISAVDLEAPFRRRRK